VLEFVPFDSAEVIGLRVSGKLEKDDIQRVIDVSEMKLSAMGQGARLRVYVEVESFGGLSFQALLEDLKFGLAHVGDIDRKAVVSDIVWMGRFAAIADPLFPSVHVKHFKFEDRDAARAWVTA
jgi:hypothetical protein